MCKVLGKIIEEKLETLLYFHSISKLFVAMGKLYSRYLYNMSTVCTSHNLLSHNSQSALLPGSQAKPADVFIPGWVNGRDAALDVTVVSSLQQELVRRAAAEVGSAAARRHSDKMSKYFQACDREGIQFFPVVVETLGGWHEDAAALITRLSVVISPSEG